VTPYAQPLLYWTAALSGLVLALLTEGMGDAIAMVLLCLPLVAIARNVLRRN
jgi:hypothetical protein